MNRPAFLPDGTPDALTAALAYARRGWAVFPLTAGSKVPLSGSRGCLDATTDERLIRRWFVSPKLNVGIATGRASGLYVVDVDAPKHEIMPRLGGTLIARTRAGGWHYVYALPLDDDGQPMRLPNTNQRGANALAEHVDTRGEGGYIVVWPSVVVEEREGAAPAVGRYEWQADCDPAPLPAWIVERVKPREPSEDQRQAMAALRRPTPTAYGATALQRECDEVASTPEGGRNHRLNVAAYSLGRLAAGGYLSRLDVEEGLLRAALAAGLTEREARSTIESGLAGGRQAGARHPETRPMVREHRGAPPEPTASPALPAIIPPPSGVLSRTPPQRDYLAWQMVDAQPPRGVIGRGQLHMLAAEGGAGKGRWTMALAVALAAAPRPAPREDGESPGGMSNVCGLEVAAIGEHERVLLLLGEDDQTDFWQRCQATALEGLSLGPQHEDRLRARLRWATAHGMPFSIAEEQRAADGRAAAVPTAAWESFVGELKREAEAHPWALIVIDPLARFGGVNENDNALQTQLMTIIEGLTRVNGEGQPMPAVLVVDHTAKPADRRNPEAASQHAIRGASGKVNAARVVMQMTPGGRLLKVDPEGRALGDEGFDLHAPENLQISEGEVTWHVVKNNGARKANPVPLNFTKNGGLCSESPHERMARRKRQWHQAEKERLLKEAADKRGRKSSKSADSAAAIGDDEEITGGDDA